MLLLGAAPGALPRIRIGDEVHLIPRRDGQVLLGSTLEKTGFEQTPTAAARAALTICAAAARREAQRPATARPPAVWPPAPCRMDLLLAGKGQGGHHFGAPVCRQWRSDPRCCLRRARLCASADLHRRRRPLQRPAGDGAGRLPAAGRRHPQRVSQPPSALAGGARIRRLHAQQLRRSGRAGLAHGRLNQVTALLRGDGRRVRWPCRSGMLTGNFRPRDTNSDTENGGAHMSGAERQGCAAQHQRQAMPPRGRPAAGRRPSAGAGA